LTRRIHGEYKPKPEQLNTRAQRPRMPEHLSPVAQAKWREIVRELYKRNTVTRVDGTAIEIICNQYERLRECQKEIAEHGIMVEEEVSNGSGNVYTRRSLNPACKQATSLENSIRAMLMQLGSTPASRERAKAAKTSPKDAPLPADSAGALAANVFDQIENDEVPEIEIETLDGDPEGEK
jgi:P27 family predicted phage terminase small subunit